MILSDRYRFIFIHVPKCAGTSVRAAVLPYHDADDRFLKTVEKHPKLGEIDYRHLPLPLLRKLDPEAFHKLKHYDSYALLRDPFQRFRSAMAQRAKMYLGKEFAQMDEQELGAEVERVMDYLRSEPTIIAPEFIHFARQSDFIQLGDERLVRHLYPVERVDLFVQALGQHIGTDTLRVGHANRTTVFRYPGLKHAMKRGSALTRYMLPHPVHETLRRSARRVLMKPSAKADFPGLQALRIQEFIRRHYAIDIKLYQEILAETSACA